MTMNKLSAIMLTWFGGQVVCYIVDGLVLGGPNGMLNGMMQSALGFNVASANGFSVIQIAVSFVTSFIPKLLFWNFSFLDGWFFIIRVLLICIITVPAIYGLWQGLRGN